MAESRRNSRSRRTTRSTDKVAESTKKVETVVSEQPSEETKVAVAPPKPVAVEKTAPPPPAFTLQQFLSLHGATIRRGRAAFERRMRNAGSRTVSAWRAAYDAFMNSEVR